MDSKVILLAIFICLSVSYCCFRDFEPKTIDVLRPELTDRKTGVKYEPREVFDLLKVIKKDGRYIGTTNAQQRLYDLRYNMEFERIMRIDYTYSDEQQLAVSGGPVVNQTQCGQQLHWILDKLNTTGDYLTVVGRTAYELTMYMDSFGRLGTGAYSGIFDWLGSYDQCMKASLDWGNIKTRYCIARMRPTWWKTDRIKTRSAYRIGICLPETCDTLSCDLHKSSIEHLIKPSMVDGHNQSFEFESMFC